MDLFSHGRPWVKVTLRLLVSSSCNQTIKNAIDKSIDEMEFELSASGGGSFGLQSEIGLH